MEVVLRCRTAVFNAQLSESRESLLFLTVLAEHRTAPCDMNVFCKSQSCHPSRQHSDSTVFAFLLTGKFVSKRLYQNVIYLNLNAAVQKSDTPSIPPLLVEMHQPFPTLLFDRSNLYRSLYHPTRRHKLSESMPFKQLIV